VVVLRLRKSSRSRASSEHWRRKVSRARRESPRRLTPQELDRVRALAADIPNNNLRQIRGVKPGLEMVVDISTERP
jgi:hypothetical protein